MSHVSRRPNCRSAVENKLKKPDLQKWMLPCFICVTLTRWQKIVNCLDELALFILIMLSSFSSKGEEQVALVAGELGLHPARARLCLSFIMRVPASE